MLKQRIITAVILATVFIGTILFASEFWVRMMFALFLGISLYELSELTLRSGSIVSLALGLGATVVFSLSDSFIDGQLIEYQAMVGSLIWIGLLIYLFVYRFSGNWPLITRVVFFVIGSGLLWICTSSLLFIHGNTVSGGWVLLYLMTLVWIADIGAYFSGRKFGKNKLAPGISPGKTWEGVLGGIITNILWMTLIFFLAGLLETGLLWFLAIGIATSAISVVGDLFESILKREAGVKDSGWILPGHGGVLDRFDSIIAAAPVFLAGLFLSGSV